MHELSLEGAFTHPHWLAFLCGGLSAARVSVVSGNAVRLSPMQWKGQFLVDGPVEGLDVLKLAATRPTVRDATTPRLSSYAIARRTDGQLELKVTAPDSLGFLGRLLSRISLLTLLPSGLEISTVKGDISDVFVLTGIGTAGVNDEVAGALEAMLAPMVTT
ncbi:MAG: hypothetical protein JWM40_1249 [Frankiales bacterium]|nr:hypothetical protein [Frankiales bacterium]